MPLGRGIEKFPTESVSPVANTCDPAEVLPKTELVVVVDADDGGGKTSIWSWLPGEPSGSKRVPKIFSGSWIAG